MDKKQNTTAKKSWTHIFTLELLAVLLIFLCIIVFVYAARMVFIHKNTGFDDATFDAIRPYITPSRTRFMEFITLLGKHTILIPLNLLLIAYFLFKRKKWFAIRIAALSLSSLLLKIILKISFQRERPASPVIQDVAGFSFPSGHALVGIVFYGLLIYVVWKTVEMKWLRYSLSFFFLILIILISFSRIYLRVHYASDVIAGLAVGFIWLILSLSIISRIEKRYIARRTLQREKLLDD